MLTLTGCANGRRICCRASSRIHQPRITLVQCCWPFRVCEASRACHSVNFIATPTTWPSTSASCGMAQNSNRNRRQRMGLQNNFLAAHAAPAASMAVPSLHEIDRPLVLGSPRTLDYLVFRFVHLNKTTGRKNGIHGEILRAHIAVSEIGIGELREVREREPDPIVRPSGQDLWCGARQIRDPCAPEPAPTTIPTSVGNMRFWRRNQAQVCGHVAQVHAIP